MGENVNEEGYFFHKSLQSTLGGRCTEMAVKLCWYSCIYLRSNRAGDDHSSPDL